MHPVRATVARLNISTDPHVHTVPVYAARNRKFPFDKLDEISKHLNVFNGEMIKGDIALVAYTVNSYINTKWLETSPDPEASDDNAESTHAKFCVGFNIMWSALLYSPN